MMGTATAKVYLGTVIYYTNDERLEEYKQRLLAHYAEQQARYCHEGRRSWCSFDAPKIVQKDMASWCMEKSVGIKWRVRGRAWYIKRTFKEVLKYVRRHGTGKSVPKHKRGRLWK